MTATIPGLLIEWLASYRARGASFDVAFGPCVARACRGKDAAFWRATFTEQCDVWRRSYDRGPQTRGEAAWGALFLEPSRDLQSLVRELAGVEAPGRVCVGCGGEIPPRRRAHAIYCSRDCRRRALWRREKAQKANNHGPTGASLSVPPTSRATDPVAA